MNFAEHLAKLRKAREATVAKMAALHEGAAAEARVFTEAEQSAFDTCEAEIKALDKQIASTESVEKLMANSDTLKPVVEPTGTSVVVGQRANPRISVERNLPKGTVFTRYAMALAASKGNLTAAAEMAKNNWGDSTPEVYNILKSAVAAGTTTDTNWAKPIADYKIAANEFIDLLRPATIIGKMAGFRRVPFNVRIPRQTSGATVGWVGQAGGKPVSKLQFDSVTIPLTKVAGIVVITQELARLSDPSAEALVQSDLIATIAQFTDAQFIDPSVAASANVSPASVLNSVTSGGSIPQSGTTVAAILTDTTAAMTHIANANVDLAGLYWVMSPRTFLYLSSLRTAQDVWAFPGLQDNANPTFRGIPVIVSTGIVTNLGVGTNESYIGLVCAPETLLADDGQVMLDASQEAAVAMDSTGSGTLTSLWQNNLIGIRAERFMHWLRRRDAAFAVITAVTY